MGAGRRRRQECCEGCCDARCEEEGDEEEEEEAVVDVRAPHAMTVLFVARVTASEGQARQHSDGEGDCAGQRWHLRTSGFTPQS